jgi:hypothetical protein
MTTFTTGKLPETSACYHAVGAVLDGRARGSVNNRQPAAAAYHPRVRRLALALVLAALAAPAGAQMYKWIDDKGVTNYGSTPPANARSVEKVDERVSTVPGLKPEIEPGGSGAAKQVSPEPPRAQPDAAADAQARERCIAERRVDCDDPHRGQVEYDYGWGPYPPAILPPRPRPVPPRPGPGPGPRPTPR